MPVSTVIFDGDASGAVAAAKETQAAIDSVHGKSVDIEVNTRGAGPSAAILATIGENADSAASAHDRLGRAEDRAAASARDSANAHARASDGMREHSTAAERHNRLIDQMRDGTDRSTASVEDAATAHDRAKEAAKAYYTELGRKDTLGDSDRPAKLAELRSAWRDARDAAKAYTDSTAPTGASPRSPVAPSVPSGGATQESYDMPGRAARVDALQAATNRLALAQTKAAATAAEYHTEFQKAFDSAPSGTNAAAYAEKATQGLRNEMTASMGAFRAARNDVKGLEESFDGASRTSSGLMRGLTSLASGTLPGITSVAGDAGGALRVLGMGALVGAAGAGILGAATAAIGAGTALGVIKETGPLAYQASGALHAFGKAFGDVGQQATAAGLPAMRAFKSTVGELGKELAGIGVANLKSTVDGMSTMTRDVGRLAADLSPAIKPAERAFTDLFGAATKGIGQLTPDIAAFSQAISANAPGIQQAVEGIGRGMLGIGTGVVEGLAAAGPMLEWMGNELTGTGPSISGTLNQTADWLQNSFLGSSEDWSTGTLGAITAPLRHIPGLGAQGGDLSYWTGGGDSGPSSFTMDDANALGKKMGATWAHTTVGKQPGEGTHMAGDSAPLGMEGPASDDPWALRGTGQRQGVVPKPTPAADSVPTASQEATPKPSVLTPQQEQQKPLTQLPRSVGESGPGLQGTAQQLATLNQEMAKTTNMSPLMQQSMSSVGQAAQASMMQAGNAAQQGAPQFQQGLNQMQQHAQQLPPQIGSTMSMLGPALQQPMQQAMPQAAQAMQPQPIADAAGAAVTKAVRQVQPAAESSGQDLGASVPEGTSQGITKNVDKVITIVEHLIKKVIQAGADGLQTASPSRVFDAFGRSIPDGLAQGIQNQSDVAVQATTGLIGQMTQAGSQQVNQGVQTQQQQLAQAQQKLQADQQQLASTYQQPPGFGGSPYSPQNQQAKLAEQQQKSLSDQLKNQYAGHMAELPADIAAKIATGQSLNQTDAQKLQNIDQRKQSLERFGWNKDTLDRVARQDQHRADLGHAAFGRLQNDWTAAHPGEAWASDPDLSPKQKAMHLARNPSPEAREAMRSQGNIIGHAFTDGASAGLEEGKDKAGNSSRNVIGHINKEGKKEGGVSSPSTVWAGIGSDLAAGLGVGLSNGMPAAFNAGATALEGVASDRGLPIGYRYATSIATGMQSVFKSADFQANAVPQIQNDQAKSVLGQLGLLGPAGSGASIYKTAMVAFGGGASSSGQSATIHNHLYIDGNEIRLLAGQVADVKLDRLISDLNNAHSAQVS